MQRLINPGDLKVYAVTAVVFAVLSILAAGVVRFAGASVHPRAHDCGVEARRQNLRARGARAHFVFAAHQR